MYRQLLKPILFRLDPEKAHHLTLNALSAADKWPGMIKLLEMTYGVGVHEQLATELWGIRFPHPVGLAAGLDKNGVAVTAFSSVGFGFMEVGTVTPLGQPGNELPRLFRLPSDEALINRMGFNNEGADALAGRLRNRRRNGIPIAINIGKNKVTPNDKAIDDYIACIRKLYPYGDMFVVNISSPNTPDLRNLQHGEYLRSLLQEVTTEMEQMSKLHARSIPILVKIAPDVSDDELEQMTETIADSGISGIIATNTTLSRIGLTHAHAGESGGLSGKPVKARSTEIIRRIYIQTKGKLPIIGCGGIFSAEDAYEKIRAGASLVEIYTSLIYKGPGVNRELTSGLVQLLRKDGFTHVSQAVGVDASSS